MGLRKKSKATLYRGEDIGARKQSPPAAGSAKSFLPRWKIFHGVSHAGLRKNQCIRDRPEKEFPDEKVLHGRYALGLRKKSKAAMYRSENIGARKQSPPAAGSAKSFLPRWKIFHGVSHAGLRKNQCIRDRPEKEFPDEKVLHGRYALGLRKKSKAAMYRSENIGARKQSPPAAGSAKSFLPR